LGGRSAAQNITGGAHSAPPDPLVAPTWWEGSFCHFPRIPPALGIWPWYSTIRASFGCLPNILHSPQCLLVSI